MTAPTTQMITAKQMPAICLPLKELADEVGVGLLCEGGVQGIY